MNENESRPAYLLVSDGSVHTGDDDPPRGLFVRGQLNGSDFLPEGDIQGDGTFGAGGMPGWMELRDGSFHADNEARAPFPPYLPGSMSKDGVFSPHERRVRYR